MVSVVPTIPLVGEKLVIVGAMTKSVALVAAPPVVVTVIGPDSVPTGTVTTRLVAAALVTVAVRAPNLTVVCVAGVANAVPVIVTELPIAPKAGAKPVTAGAGIESDPGAVPLSPATVTSTVPPVDPTGTCTVSAVAVALTTPAARALPGPR